MHASKKYVERKRKETIKNLKEDIKFDKQQLRLFRQKNYTDPTCMRLQRQIIESTEIQIAIKVSQIKRLMSKEVNGEQFIEIFKQS